MSCEPARAANLAAGHHIYVCRGKNGFITLSFWKKCTGRAPSWVVVPSFVLTSSHGFGVVVLPLLRHLASLAATSTITSVWACPTASAS